MAVICKFSILNLKVESWHNVFLLIGPRSYKLVLVCKDDLGTSKDCRGIEGCDECIEFFSFQ